MEVSCSSQLYPNGTMNHKTNPQNQTNPDNLPNSANPDSANSDAQNSREQREERATLLRSSALVVAVAVHDVFPGFLPIEATIEEEGFCYDFLIKTSYEGDLLPLAQEKVDRLTKLDLPFEVKSMMRENAITFLEHRGLALQASYLEMRGENVVQLGMLCEYIDFCTGPLFSCSKEIGAISLTSFEYFTGYYPHLGKVNALRVRGVAFSDKKEMKRYLKKETVAQANNPVALCAEMGLIRFLEASPGRPCWLPYGMALQEKLLSLWKKECKNRGISLVATPREVLRSSMKRRTLSPLQELFPAFDAVGDTQFEEDGDLYSFSSLGDLHALLFKGRHQASCGPVRYAELLEKEHLLFAKDCDGLFRSKSCFGDVQHIFCRLEELETELISSLQFVKTVFTTLGIEYSFILRRPLERRKERDERKVGDIIASAFEKCGEVVGSSFDRMALSGPRIEVRSTDLRGRSMPIALIGIDNELPVKYDLSFKDEERVEEVFVLAQSIFVSLERIIALLVEKHEGKLPFWLTPELVKLVPMKNSGEIGAFALEIRALLEQEGIQVGIDESIRPLSAKLYDCHRSGVPFVVVIGEREVKKREIPVRHLREKDILTTYTLDAFVQMIKQV